MTKLKTIIITGITEGLSSLSCREMNQDFKVSNLLKEIENQELARQLDEAIGEAQVKLQDWAFSTGFEFGLQCKDGLCFEINGVKLRLMPDNTQPK
ncbi:MAG: hypothetical protein ACM3YE_16680 [Bacteroidota bacterium]